jgi:hypothetical protein
MNADALKPAPLRAGVASLVQSVEVMISLVSKLTYVE